MKTAIIICKQDPASMNIYEHLKSYKLKNAFLHFIDDYHITHENLDKEIEADFYLFCSTHKSKANINSLCIHNVGNWGKAEFGGKDKTICPVNASFVKTAFLELNKLAKDKFNISTEQVHHGPYLEKPSVFIEIGSTEKEWNDKERGEIIAKTIFNTLNNYKKTYKSTILLGGQHYNTYANKILLNTDLAISYICAKHSLAELDKDLFNQMLKKSKEKIEFVILDWKGLGTEKNRILDLLKNLNLEYKKASKISK